MTRKWIERYCRLLSVLMVACLAVMVVLVFTNVVMRYALNTGITVSEELSRWLFVWMTFMGAVVALHEKGHLGTDSLVSRLPTVGKKFCLGLGHLLMLAMCWLVLEGSWQQAKINWSSTSAVMETSMAYFYASGLVFAISGAVVLLNDFWRLVSGQLSNHELVGVRESEDVPHAQPRSSESTTVPTGGRQ